MENHFDILDWDSKFFGYKIASIHALKLETGDLNSIIKELGNNSIKLAYCFINPEDEVSINTMKNSSGILVDEKVTYFIHGFKEVKSVDIQIKSYGLGYPTDNLILLALQSGTYSRFKVDQNFKNNEYENLYIEWIKNSVKKTIAGENLIYYESDEEKGFITLAIKKDIGSIGLIAVDEKERGKSIGKKLVNAAFVYFKANGIDKVEVVTQKANKTACLFYESLGFEVKSIIYIYHLWIK
jgi:dTDP-4-amino-4,6-dideoxy-D-galactose acyltransferase